MTMYGITISQIVAMEILITAVIIWVYEGIKSGRRAFSF